MKGRVPGAWSSYAVELRFEPRIIWFESLCPGEAGSSPRVFHLGSSIRPFLAPTVYSLLAHSFIHSFIPYISLSRHVVPHNVLGNRHTNLNTRIRHKPCLQGFIIYWELSLDWDMRPGAELIIPPREALWWFGQMASGFNMRMRIQGLGQWGQVYC